jgi:endoglucanase
MQKESFEFLKKLLETQSPSGFEQGIQRVVKKRMSKFADTIEIDVHGNLIAAINPDAPVRVMLAGHCDQIGFMVTHIADNGYISFSPIGGLDPSVLPGSEVVIMTNEGPLPGVLGYTPVHLLPPAQRGGAIDMSRLWIDVGFDTPAAVKKRVSVGDPATVRLEARRLGKNVLSSPGCDDRVGLFVVMEALRLFRASVRGKKRFPVGLFAVSTVQEEIGLRGAKTSCYGIDPQVGIAVDVTHASDNPGADPKQVGTVKLGSGPTIARGPNINPVIEKLLIETAKKKKLKYQPLSSPGATGTDANMIQVSRSGVAAALLGIPNRYMHTAVELVDLRDLETSAALINETVLRITPKTDFRPS